MYLLDLDKKSGFICDEVTINIYDSSGLIFYTKLNSSFEPLFFNLPSGVYTTKNTLTQIEKTREYKKYNLPTPNEKTKLPEKIEIYFIKNPNKCSVDMSTNSMKIYFDFYFKGKPKAFFDYIKFHELGHYFFKGQGQRSEKFCDAFSFNKMIDLGYNPSQVYGAQKIILSERPAAKKRKDFIYRISKNSTNG